MSKDDLPSGPRSDRDRYLRALRRARNPFLVPPRVLGPAETHNTGAPTQPSIPHAQPPSYTPPERPAQAATPQVPPIRQTPGMLPRWNAHRGNAYPGPATAIVPSMDDPARTDRSEAAGRPPARGFRPNN